jgi:hypothetical protein
VTQCPCLLFCLVFMRCLTFPLPAFIVYYYCQWFYNCTGGCDWLRDGRSGNRIPAGMRFSAPVQTGPGAHPASCTMNTGSFPVVKNGRGVTLTPHPFQCHCHERVELYVYSPYGPPACTEPQYLYKNALYLYLYR